jgi:alpha-glucosidase
LLHFYRQLLRWRKTRHSLVSGTLEVLEPHPQVLAYVRRFEDEITLCALNFSADAVSWSVPTAFAALRPVEGSGLAPATYQNALLTLPAWGGAFLGNA